MLELSVRHAIAEGIILRTEVSSGILRKLNIIALKGSQNGVERDAE